MNMWLCCAWVVLYSRANRKLCRLKIDKYDVYIAPTNGVNETWAGLNTMKAVKRRKGRHIRHHPKKGCVRWCLPQVENWRSKVRWEYLFLYLPLYLHWSHRWWTERGLAASSGRVPFFTHSQLALTYLREDTVYSNWRPCQSVYSR